LSEKLATLQAALAHTARLLQSDPKAAEAQAREILRTIAGQPEALLLLGSALRRQGDPAGARDVLKELTGPWLRSAAAQYELGLAYADLRDGSAAVSTLRRAAELNPKHPHAWRALGDQLTLAGDDAGADEAYARHIQASVNDPKLLEAAAALNANDLAVAERLLRAFLKDQPTDVTAIRMLAELGSRLGRYADAEHLLARALELAPSFTFARHNYASVLFRRSKLSETLEQADLLLARDPRNPAYRNLKAAALARRGETHEALELYESVLNDFPKQPKAWMSYGHTLKSAGRQTDGIGAYRRAIALLPSLGEAWWSLANLKTLRFTPDEIAQMRTQLARTDIGEEDRFHLQFALGKALEDAEQFAESFRYYEQGNALRGKELPYKADETSALVARLKSVFTADFVHAHSDVGAPDPDPIFIVGLPRAGSTLIEQILASHSAVEGTMELPDIFAIVRRLGGKERPGQASAYPEVLASLADAQFAQLGKEYIERTRVYRKLGRPFFIDKMPNNFFHAGLIHLMLPNAKIVDARRHPLGCCFSGFKQHFARGQGHTYNLTDIGRYYADYADLMAHYDRVMPGQVHRVIYERMVEQPEEEVRRLLAYCGLPFEEGCLRFYQNDRAVRTASSEQVRMPIFKDAVDHWQNYDAWLGPLKQALGPVLQSYPDAPVP
jgi:tetratricopeptide (TPR) repeat protein